MRSRNLWLVAILVFISALSSCRKEMEESPFSKENDLVGTSISTNTELLSLSETPLCGSFTNLKMVNTYGYPELRPNDPPPIYDRFIDVQVGNDATNLYVKFTAAYDFQLKQIKLIVGDLVHITPLLIEYTEPPVQHVGPAVSDYVMTPTPAPDRTPSGIATYTFTIPRSSLPEGCVYVYAWSLVEKYVSNSDGSLRYSDGGGVWLYSDAKTQVNSDPATSYIQYCFKDCPASLGDRVWIDMNANGVQDASETGGIPGVTVTLYRCSDNTTVGVPVTTDANGNYSFSGLTPGNYYVRFSNLPAGYVVSPKDMGNDDALDSDMDPGTGKTACVTLKSGENNTTVDAGLYPTASLGDRVWIDMNANGIQDPTETTGIAGVTVTLYRCSDNTTVGVPVTTNANGNYNFSGLIPGSYYVKFSNLPAGYIVSPKDMGADDALDSDMDPATGKTGCVTLNPGENNTTVDAGLYPTASLGDRVWIDMNANGIQDATETTGIAGVTVTLYRCSDNTIIGVPVTTNANGNYNFSGLMPGSYYVKFSNLPAGYVFSPKNVGLHNSLDAFDSDADLSGKTGCVTLNPGENNTTIDAGLYKTASLGDRVWSDLNSNGIQDATETTGIVGVTVTLYRCSDNTIVGVPVTTNANGNYNFSGLMPGSYYVKFSNLPAGYVLSPKDIGLNDALDSDADPAGKTGCVTLNSGENNTTVDAGLYKLACGMLRTQTPGGWGAKPSGFNPGTYLTNNFAKAFPTGLVIGSTAKYYVKFTASSSVTAFLPAGGTAAKLTKSWTNPTTTNLPNILATHLLSLTLNVQFDATDASFGPASVLLGDMKIGSGKFKGWTVKNFLAEANKVFGGLASSYTVQDILTTAVAINENYIDAISNKGFLVCPF
jgi:hypothetical protein